MENNNECSFLFIGKTGSVFFLPNIQDLAKGQSADLHINSSRTEQLNVVKNRVRLGACKTGLSPPPPQVILYYWSFKGDTSSVVVPFVLCFGAFEPYVRFDFSYCREYTEI